MKAETQGTVKFPIRRKILLSLSFAVTLVVSLIVVTMATFFHQDKRAYINDWVSIAAVSTADECRSLLVSYKQRLVLYAEILLNDSMAPEEKRRLLQAMFDELPELIQVAVYEEGKEIDVADDRASLEEAGLTRDDLRAWREANPLPLERLLAGETWVANATQRPELPVFTLAFARFDDADLPPLVIAATLRTDDLQRLGANFKVFEVALATADGTLLAHPDPSRVAARERLDDLPQTELFQGRERAGMTLEYERDGVATIAGFAPIDPGQLTVAVQIPEAAAYLASRDLLRRLMLVAVVLMALASATGLIWARGITRPVERLSRATREIAKGDFGIAVEVHSRDEIGALAGSFNQMVSELNQREHALKEAHGQLIQSEKMAAFGQLGAGIAHEVKNPLAGVLGCAQLALMEVAPGSDVHENLRLIEKETQRCRDIIENLLRFARQEKAVLAPTDVNRVVRDAMAIVHHQLEMHQVKLHAELAPSLPEVRGNANQLQQVLMNLIINAQQAMEGKPGKVTVSTRAIERDVEIVVRDNGPGIPRDVQARLFEPFFTTKPAGKGTGLGLSVSFGIIQDHEGTITVQSTPGEGAAFVMRIPVAAEQPRVGRRAQGTGAGA